MVSNLTAKQITFCEQYAVSRDIKQSSLNAGYSESYSRTKAYNLLKDERIISKVQELERDYNQEHFKTLALQANKELEDLLIHSENESVKLKTIELIYKLSGIIADDKIALQINNQNVNQVKTIDDIYTLDDFYD